MINQTKQKTVFIETYGCQMNMYDTELVQGILAKRGFQFVDAEESADIVMLNTCAIRENAHRKVYGRIHDIKHKRKLAAKNELSPRGDNSPLIGILGCMATNLRTDLLEDKHLGIDFIAGPDSYKRLPQLIDECYAVDAGADPCIGPNGRTQGPAPTKPFDVTLSEFETYSDVFPDQRGVNPSTHPSGSLRVNAWIAVMRGCNNFCTFCVVPYTRGRERSRSVENIVEEAKQLADNGFKQITLLGQNVNSYNHEGDDFAALIDEVSKVNGIERIRFTSPHPKDFPDRLLDVVANNPKVCKQVHLPLQAGSNRILDLMNRTYTKEEFYALVDKFRTYCPGIALSTDIIVGFCSETDEDFEQTVEVMQKVEFDSAFIFKYSERKNTIASKKYPDDVAEAIKTERIVRLNEIQKEVSLKKYQAYVGKMVNVLIEEERTSKSTEQFQGRTDDNKLVLFAAGPYKRGDFINVAITEASPHSLRGVVKE